MYQTPTDVDQLAQVRKLSWKSEPMLRGSLHALADVYVNEVTSEL